METTPKLTPFNELFRETWNLYKERFPFFVQIVALPTLLVLAGSFGIVGPAADLVLTLLGVLFSFVSLLALIYSVKDKVGFSQAYRSGFSKLWAYGWTASLSGLTIAGGFFMGVIPGIIFSIWFILNPYVLVFEGSAGYTAILKSKEYIRGYWWPIFFRIVFIMLFFLVFFGIASLFVWFLGFRGSLGGAMAQSIYQIFAVPFFVAYFINLYSNLASLKPQVNLLTEFKKGFFVFSAVLGALLIIAVFVLTLAATFWSLPYPDLKGLPLPS